jgi:hypothetical protein
MALGLVTRLPPAREPFGADRRSAIERISPSGRSKVRRPPAASGLRRRPSVGHSAALPSGCTNEPPGSRPGREQDTREIRLRPATTGLRRDRRTPYKENGKASRSHEGRRLAGGIGHVSNSSRCVDEQCRGTAGDPRPASRGMRQAPERSGKPASGPDSGDSSCRARLGYGHTLPGARQQLLELNNGLERRFSHSCARRGGQVGHISNSVHGAGARGAGGPGGRCFGRSCVI